MGLVGSGIGAYMNLSPIESTEKYRSQAMQLGNTNYQLGSLQALADQYANRIVPQSITGNDLYNPSVGERFGQLFGSGISGFQAGYNFADNFTGDMGTTFIQKGSGYNTASDKGWGKLGDAIEEQVSSGEDFSGLEGINKLMQKFNVKGVQYDSGGLMLNNGSMINAAAGLGMAGINMGLNAISNAIRRRRASREAQSFNALRDFSIDRNQLDLNRAVNDSSDNMFNMMALNRKALGGPMSTNGAQWSNGLTFINNGGTHEQNPLEGVPMGIAPDGVPNRVEEDEVIYNNYVYSDRLTIPKKENKSLGLKKDRTYTYAEAAKELAKESEERPNDPISKRGLDNKMGLLRISQDALKEKKDMERLSKDFNKLSPEEQAYALQTLDYSSQQLPLGDNVFAVGGRLFSGKGGVNPREARKLGFPVATGFYFNGGSWNKFNKKFKKELEETRKTLNETSAMLQALGSRDESKSSEQGDGSQEDKKENKTSQDKGNTTVKYTPMWNAAMAGKNPSFPQLTTPTPKDHDPLSAAILKATKETGEQKEQEEKAQQTTSEVASEESSTVKNNTKFNFSPESWLRYAPLIASGIASLAGNKVDYSNPNLIAANTRNTNFIPLGDYLSLQRIPMASTLGNRMSAQAAATNAAIMNTAANRAAAIPSLLTAGYKNQTALANAYLDAFDYNNQLTEREATFNGPTNEYNSRMGVNVAEANQRTALQSAIERATLQENIDRTISAANSTNLTNLVEGLQNIGRESADRAALQQLIASGVFGSMSEDQRKGLTRSGAYGGKFKTRKNKHKGLTY